MLSKTLSRTGLLIGSVAAVKAAIITINDEWDVVQYDAKKKMRAVESWIGTNITPQPLRKPKVIVVGTGWGALSFLQYLDQDDVQLTIVSPRTFFFYTPLLAGTAVGTVSNQSIVEPIRWYFNRAGHSGASFVQATCDSVNLKNKVIRCTDIRGQPLDLHYDYLVVSVGAEPATFGIPGVKEFATFMKEVEDGMKVQKQILERLEAASAILAGRQDQSSSIAAATSAGSSSNDKNNDLMLNKKKLLAEEQEIDRLLHWVVIGGGPTGVELVAELGDFVREDVAKYFPQLAGRVKITLIEATDRLLGAFDTRMASYAHTALQQRGAEVLCGAMVTKITKDFVEIKKKTTTSSTTTTTTSPPVYTVSQIPYGALIWAGGIAVRPLVKAIATQIGPKEQTSRWGLEVDRKLCVKGVSDGSVWALGDCAVSGCAPTAQAASQQGKYLGRLFRDTKLSPDAVAAYPVFEFHYKGSLAYLGVVIPFPPQHTLTTHSINPPYQFQRIGDGKGVAEIRGLWDHYPGQQTKGQVVGGTSAFALWRSLYFSKLMSSRNQTQVAFDWLKASVFGRDISTPHNIQLPPPPSQRS